MAEANKRESPKDTFVKLIKVVEAWARWKKYWQTRAYLLKSRRPFEDNASDLRREDVMGPLAFNVYETTLAGIPGAAVAAALWFLFPSAAAGTTSHPYNFDDAFDHFAQIFDKILEPFIVPTLLFCTAWIASWATLRKRDSTKVMRRRIRNAYLYYDGALGLYPEAFAGLMTALYGAFSDHSKPDWAISGVALACIAVGLWQTLVTFRRIRRRLFTLAGYVSPPRPLALNHLNLQCSRLQVDDVWYGYRRYQPDRPRPKPPRLRFFILFGVCGPFVLGFVAVMLGLFQVVLAAAMAGLQIWVRSKI